MLLVLIAFGILAVCTFFLVRAFRRGKAENEQLWGELSAVVAARNAAEAVSADKEEQIEHLRNDLDGYIAGFRAAEAQADSLQEQLAIATSCVNASEAKRRDVESHLREHEAAERHDVASLEDAWTNLENAEKELAELGAKFKAFQERQAKKRGPQLVKRARHA
jgi:chromosome segregation ATPase